MIEFMALAPAFENPIKALIFMAEMKIPNAVFETHSGDCDFLVGDLRAQSMLQVNGV